MSQVKPLYLVTQKTSQAITGIANFTALAGTGVQIKGGDGTSEIIELELAVGGGAYILTRDILLPADYSAAMITESHLGNTFGSFISPVQKGFAASAHEARSAEYEGAMLDASIDAATAVGTKVAWVAGKLKEWTAGDVAGQVTSILVPETAGETRVMVTFVL
jgi:hypothetical protein